jgi:hypothetical protein
MQSPQALLECTRLFLWYTCSIIAVYPINNTRPCEILIPPFLNNLGFFATLSIPLWSNLSSVSILTQFFCNSSEFFGKFIVVQRQISRPFDQIFYIR